MNHDHPCGHQPSPEARQAQASEELHAGSVAGVISGCRDRQTDESWAFFSSAFGIR